ncbi:hypothetical protein O7630_31690 [Micromonospora sp. WMMD718]|uniref:hypothetical protein n=1 Tax=Micromonospora sp. WMMD718 TaxID=3016098 RepID=UPI0024162605|nr:hypothetical protein [Micromonospora sp. WMMD718]MDG4755509.1 hypothetical protein [Micromonospora sp. WMMD718]
MEYEDGRSPHWPADSLAVDVWETMNDEVALTGPQMARLRLALDSLVDADALAADMVNAPDRERIAAATGARAARKVVADLIAALTAPPKRPVGRPPKSGGKHRDARHTTYNAPDDEDSEDY